jgi:hypothetical protein
MTVFRPVCEQLTSITESCFCGLAEINWAAMRKRTKIVIAASGILAILCALAVYLLRNDPADPRNMHEAPENHASWGAIALKLYAFDHDGFLPDTLSELIPKYAPNTQFIAHMELVTPKAELEKLPPRSIILTYSPPALKDYLVVVHADTSAERVHR